MRDLTPAPGRSDRQKSRLLMAAGCAVVVPLALLYGFRFGEQLMGPLLGVVTAANTALLAVLTVDAVVDRLAGPRRTTAAE